MSSIAIKNAYGYTQPEATGRLPAGWRIRGLLPALMRAPQALVEQVLVWQDRSNQRAHLRRLDDRLLRDMGMSLADAEREAHKPFWRA